MTEKTALSANNIHKYFAGVHALDDVSVAFQTGSVHCLAGENGSGKSTLIKVVSGVEVPDEGSITLWDSTHASVTPRLAIKNGVQVIHQDLSLFSNLTLAENIAFGRLIAAGTLHFNQRKAKAIAAEACRRINIDLPLTRLAGEVSIAQRQLSAICRALVQDTRVLFMDEPTTALTKREVDSLLKVVEHLRDQGVSVVFVSHKFNEVLNFSDRITVLRSGRVVSEGPASDFSRASLSRAMTGHAVAMMSSRESPVERESVALSARNLGVEGKLFDVSLDLYHGEVLGITGLLGSGRDVIGEALFGISPVSSGEIRVDQQLQRINSVSDAIRAGIGYVPPDRLEEGLFLDQSIARNAVSAGTDLIPRSAGLIRMRSIAHIARRLVDDFAIKASSPRAAVRTLSGGNQQRIVLAKWFLRDLKVLILNGPTVGVDIGSKYEIMMLLRDLAGQGKGIIVISDDITELAQVADRVLLVSDGTITAELAGGEVTEESIEAELAM